MDTGQRTSSARASISSGEQKNSDVETFEVFIREVFGLAVYLVVCIGKDAEWIDLHDRLGAVRFFMMMRLRQCRRGAGHGSPEHVRMRDTLNLYDKLYRAAYSREAATHKSGHAQIDEVKRVVLRVHSPSDLTELALIIFKQFLPKQEEKKGVLVHAIVPTAVPARLAQPVGSHMTSNPPPVEKKIQRLPEVGPHAEFLERLIGLGCKSGEMARVRKMLTKKGRAPEDVANGYAMAGERQLAEMIMKALGKDPAQIKAKQVRTPELRIEPKGAAHGRRGRERGKRK